MITAPFIKTPTKYKSGYNTIEPVPRFRKSFYVKGALKSACLSVCGLGYGKYFLNGKCITEDKFIVPTSDYNKTLWYMLYDVKDYLTTGKNIAAAMLGFGFFNENHKTAWDHNLAPWRDNPKLVWQLNLEYSSGETETINSDSAWRCSVNGEIRFSQLRSGEHTDLRLKDNWIDSDYDDNDWDYAVVDSNPPKGTFRLTDCEPIRECEVINPKSVIKSGKKYVFDYGRNICGYSRLNIKQNCGDKIVIRYSERINPDGSLNLDGVDFLNFEAPFQTDELILNGESTVWSPEFVYHGFRYIEVDGLSSPPQNDTVCAVYVHQMINQRTDFYCSNEKINRLFKMGQASTINNFCYMPTDCPTREKYGWCNDARASTEQFLLDFSCEKIMKKWMTDIADSIRPDGAMPGIVPSPGWGYEWGSGPISSGILFELPLREYKINRNPQWLIENIDNFERHLKYVLSRADESDGLIGYGLCDWAGPYETFESSPVPLKFSDTALYINFLQVAILAAELGGDNRKSKFVAEKDRITELFKKEYILPDGSCKIDEMAALALIIDFGIGGDLPTLAKQLKLQIERHNFHHYCGMLGLRHLYYALSKIHEDEYAYKILVSTGYPSFMEWIDERDATALCESWLQSSSYDHQMYSFFMAWLITEIAGINVCNNRKTDIIISPHFVNDLSFCRAEFIDEKGKFTVEWQRHTAGEIEINVTIPNCGTAELILPGINPVIIKENNFKYIYNL